MTRRRAAPKVATRSQISEPIEPPPPVTMTDLPFTSASSFYEILTNEPGKESWPITGATFILVHKSAEKPENTKEVLKFFDWAYSSGGKLASDLDYVPLPENVTKMIRTSWKEQIKDGSGKALWK
jgi:phosphate transport system substrate-binding protein